MKYSLILPVYNEEENIRILYERISLVMKKLHESYEMVFINDGSHDTTLQILNKLNQNDKKVKIISFSRNFGHQAAVSAGLFYSSGDQVAILDADLQDPPEILSEFFSKLDEGYDIVYAIRKNRKEPIFLKLAYLIFYRVFKTMANIEVPLDSGDFCVMTKKVVKQINQLPEHNRFIRGLRSWTGYKQTGISYTRNKRHAGTSKYSITKLFKLAFDGFISFSYIPLQFMFFMGITSMIISILGSILAIYFKYFTTAYKHVPGFATTIILIMFIGGLQLFSIGLIGEYIRRIYDEVRGRPNYIIESTTGFTNSE